MDRRGMCTMPVTCMGGKTMSKLGLSIIQMILICLAQIIVADSPATESTPTGLCLIILLAIAMIISLFLGSEGRK